MAVVAILLRNEIDRKNFETIYFFIACLYYSYQIDKVHTRWHQHIDKNECSSLQYESSLILDSMLPSKLKKTSDIQSTDKDKPNVSDNKYENCGTADFNENRVDNNLNKDITCNSPLKNQAKKLKGGTRAHL